MLCIRDSVIEKQLYLNTLLRVLGTKENELLLPLGNLSGQVNPNHSMIIAHGGLQGALREPMEAGNHLGS